MSGELKKGEFHPAASFAFRWIKSLPIDELYSWNEAFASSAIEGNRTAEICGETLNRILTGQPVSDRYLLGLAWAMVHNDPVMIEEHMRDYGEPAE